MKKTKYQKEVGRVIKNLAKKLLAAPQLNLSSAYFVLPSRGENGETIKYARDTNGRITKETTK